MEVSLETYRQQTGTEVGLSDWLTVDQSKINQFADATDDHQFIHVDPEKAAETEFGGPIAHGFLLLSLLVPMASSALPSLKGKTMGVNYGFEKIRFVSPVHAGARIRGRFFLADLTDRPDGSVQTRMQVTVEIEGSETPALVAEWLGLSYF